MRTEGLTCPKCQQPATLEHLRENAGCSGAVRSLISLYGLSRRTVVTRAGGRPRELGPCPRCGAQVCRTEIRRGHPGCPAA